MGGFMAEIRRNLAALNTSEATAAKPSNHNIAGTNNGTTLEPLTHHVCANARGGRRCDVCFGRVSA